jgi:hypothetical protein
VKTLESWLDGRGEPTSWQMGRLIPATDAQLWFDVYGPLHDEAQRLFEARLAQQQEQALRERAALQALRDPAMETSKMPVAELPKMLVAEPPKMTEPGKAGDAMKTRDRESAPKPGRAEADDDPS